MQQSSLFEVSNSTRGQEIPPTEVNSKFHYYDNNFHH